MAKKLDWPKPPIPPVPPAAVDEHTKIAYGGEVELAVDAETRIRDKDKERGDRLWKAFESDDKIEGSLLQNFHESIRGVAKSNAERVQAIAETVQKAAAALAGIYTALLGLLYTVGEVGVPPRAILPAMFLGGAVVLSTAYVAFIRKTTNQELTTAEGTPRAKAVTQTANFIKWSRRQYLDRASYVRGAVVSLAFGLVLLPAPLLSTHGEPSVVSVPESPAWPPAAGTTDAEVVLYTAQVEEIAALRATKAAPPPPPLHPGVETVIWLVALAGLLLTAAVTWLPRFRDDLG